MTFLSFIFKLYIAISLEGGEQEGQYPWRGANKEGDFPRDIVLGRANFIEFCPMEGQIIGGRNNWGAKSLLHRSVVSVLLFNDLSNTNI